MISAKKGGKQKMSSDNLPWKTIVVGFGDEETKYELDTTERLAIRMKRSKKRSLSKQIQSIKEDSIKQQPNFVLESKVIFSCQETTIANQSTPIYTEETLDLTNIDSSEMNLFDMDKALFNDNSINLLPNIDDQNVFMSDALYDEAESSFFFA